MSRKVMMMAAVLCAASWALAEPAERKSPPPVVFRVDAHRLLSSRPISKLIYGNFIELGLARQADGMWGQMLYNRSFENLPPASSIARGERGAANDSTATWWHSGYEEPPWYTFTAAGRTELPADRPNEYWGFYHGKMAARASAQKEGAWGIGQDGLVLRAGVEYLCRGFLAHDFGDPGKGERTVTVRLVAENDPGRVIDSARVSFGPQFTECRAILRDRDFNGRACFQLVATPPGEFVADGFELTPSDALHGWRKDVIAAMMRVRPSMLRFPGGCFASYYDWREGIGPRDGRMPRRSEFWGGLEYNDVGTDEYLDLCEEVGAEPFLVVNVMTGTPLLAAEWVEYCNGSPETKMGKLRALNGHEKARKVTYWEMDNEPDRKYGPEQYARRVVEFAQAMRAVDPSIKISIEGYDSYADQWNRIFDICGQEIDFVSDRYYGEQDFVRDVPVLGAYLKKTGRRIGLCNTEWIAPFDVPPGETEAAALRDRSRMQRWYYALNAATVIQRFWRNAEWMDFANFNNLVNTWGQNVIESAKSGAWLSCAGRLFEFFTDSRAAWPVDVAPVEHDGKIHVAAALSGSQKELVINVVNMGEAADLDFTFGGDSPGWVVRSARGIAAPSLVSRNTESGQDVVTPVRPGTGMRDGHLAVQIRAYSISEVILSK